jgi:hypothetical protein
MIQVRDIWFFQDDVIAQLANIPSPSIEWMTVEEQRDSYIEHFLAILVPIRRSRALVTLSEVSWSEDFDYSNGLISRRSFGKRQYLSLKFRRAFNLSFGGCNYVSNGATVVKREKAESDAEKRDVISAHRELVVQFLRESKQQALLCIRSQRYSERSLAEFGLEISRGYQRTATSHLFWEHSTVPYLQARNRPRMACFSQIFGKCLLTL